MRHTDKIIRPLAFKGILSDTDGDGIANCDRRGDAVVAAPQARYDLLFTSSLYTLDGEAIDPTTVLGASDPDYYEAAGFSTDDVSASGLDVTNGKLYPAAKAGLLTAILAGSPVLIEWTATGFNSSTLIVYAVNLLDEDTGLKVGFSLQDPNLDPAHTWKVSANNGDTVRGVDGAVATTGPASCVFQVSSESVKASVNGQPILEASAEFETYADIDNVMLMYGAGLGYLTRIRTFDALTDDQFISLTAQA